MKPRIAIPLPTSTDEGYNERCWNQYAFAVEQSGGLAVQIALDLEPSESARLASSCAAVLLPGSPADVFPERYGARSHPKTAARDVLREAADELLLQDAFHLHKPLLGICYGHQSMNVWKGGNLVQHLETGVDHAPGRTIEEAHLLELTAGARHLAQAFEGERLAVNSSHHQAVAKPGDDLCLAGCSTGDGTVEAVEGPEGFVVGVQWHPERTFASTVSSRRLFAAFVACAAAWSGGRSTVA